MLGYFAIYFAVNEWSRKFVSEVHKSKVIAILSCSRKYVNKWQAKHFHHLWGFPREAAAVAGLWWAVGAGTGNPICTSGFVPLDWENQIGISDLSSGEPNRCSNITFIWRSGENIQKHWGSFKKNLFKRYSLKFKGSKYFSCRNYVFSYNL